MISASTSLELAGVVRDYGHGVRIGPVSFTAPQGLFLSLLGPSGCGKTTLLRCIAGFEPIDEGTLRIDGIDVSAQPAHRRGVGLVFQSYALFPHLSARNNVAFGLRLRKVKSPELEQRVSEALRIVGLEHLGERLPAELSGGQQQRVALARSLVLRPSIMLLDEPLSNLDYKLRLQMRNELLALQRKVGMTFVFVTHDQTEALALSDQIIVLSQGKIEQIGTPAEIYRRPRTRFVADFIGGSNLLPVASVEPSADGKVVAVLKNGARMTAVVSGQQMPGDKLWLAFRPEYLKLADTTETAATTPLDHLVGRPTTRVFAGDRIEVTVELTEPGPKETIVFHAPPDTALSEMVLLRAEPYSAVLVGGVP